MGRKYYAVIKGRQPGVYETWTEAQKQVDGFSGAVHRSFAQRADAETAVRGAEVTNYGQKTESSLSMKSSSIKPTLQVMAPNPPPHFKQQSIESGTGRSLIIYTDGSYRKSPSSEEKVSGYGIVVEAYGPGDRFPKETDFESKPDDSTPRVLELFGHIFDSKPTNQRAELYAIYTVLHNLEGICDTLFPGQVISDSSSSIIKVEIRTDSQYSIGCLTKWHASWKRNGWRKGDGSTPSNLSLIQACLTLLTTRAKRFMIHFSHVSAHSGIPGNERADELAKQGAFSNESIHFAAET